MNRRKRSPRLTVAPGISPARIAVATLAAGCLVTIAQAQTTPAQSPPKPETVPQPFARETEALKSGVEEELAWLNAERITVTSVSKHPEELFRAASAVHVITRDDILRSGSRTLPEILRLAPGVHAARITGNKSAVAARGFSNIFAQHMLVLVDGRSVYQANNSGVNWILEDTLFEDIDRIEVIRGPGGTLWGANAVNGVINIVTRSARETTGAYGSTGVGTEQRGFAYARFGEEIKDVGWFRGYFKHQQREENPGGYDWQNITQGGMRFDRETEDYRLTIAGDGMSTKYGDRILIPTFLTPISPDSPKTPVIYRAERINGRMQFTRTWDSETEFQAQTYYDHSRDRATPTGSDQIQDVFDVDAQMRFPVGDRLTTLVGSGYRYLPSQLNNHQLFSWSPNNRNQQLASAFIHNELDLVEERLKFSAGVKLEHNDFTGFEWQPNARLAWTPNSLNTLWASVSRAVQVPGRNQNDVVQPIVPFNQLPAVAGIYPLYVSFQGRTDIVAQELIAYEMGYRVQPHDQVNLEVAAYFNDYRNLLYGAADFGGIHPGPVPGTLVLPSYGMSGGHGSTYGFEFSGDYRASADWRLRASYSLMRDDLVHPIDGSYTENQKYPRHQIQLWSQFNLPANVDFDVIGRWVSGSKGSFQDINGYWGLDLRLAWRPTDRWELALVGQNLIKPQHFEYVEDTGVRAQVTPVPRGGYVQLTYRY